MDTGVVGLDYYTTVGLTRDTYLAPEQLLVVFCIKCFPD